MSRPIYKNFFSRDFTLVTTEIWWRGETINPKIWTDRKQPYLPYIIFENTGPVINGYYDPRGIKWIEQVLINKGVQTGSFAFVETTFRQKIKKLKPIYEKQPFLNRRELLEFLKQYEDIWPWFEGVWWGWESILYNKYNQKLKSAFAQLMKVRKESEYFVPGSESTVRKSLERLYPSLGDLVAVLRLQDVISDHLPPLKTLEKRAAGYFFVNNELYVGKTRAFIENKFKIQLEKKMESKDIREFKGQPAFKGLVRGVVKIVYGIRQAHKVMKGDIIVAPMTLPDILPAMRRAAAFVTDEGGVACHAAIIAREYKKPCIVATKISTQVLKDGDLVEVDANNGVVRKLS